MVVPGGGRFLMSEVPLYGFGMADQRSKSSAFHNLHQENITSLTSNRYQIPELREAWGVRAGVPRPFEGNVVFPDKHCLQTGRAKTNTGTNVNHCIYSGVF